VSAVTTVSATVAWRPVPGAAGYQLHASATDLRHVVDGPAVPLPAGHDELSSMSEEIDGLLPGVNYVVWVDVRHRDGPAGVSDQRPFATQPAQNPTGFTATTIGPGAVRLEWQAVPGAREYIVEGSNLAQMRTSGTAVAVSNLAPGTHQWTVLAVFGEMGLFNDLNPSRVAATLAAQGPTRYRVTLNGFRLDRQTVDDALERDGKGDEVYIGIGIDEYGYWLGAHQRHDFIRTGTFGDKNGFPASTRMLAGTAGGTGGLRSGDVYPGPNPAVRTRPTSTPASPYADLPLTLWEGEMVDFSPGFGGIAWLILAVQVWEWDGDPYAFDGWQSLLISDHATRRGSDADRDHFGARGLERPQGIGEFGFDIPYVHANDVIVAAQLTGRHSEGDRPVGLKASPRGGVHVANETTIVLTKKNMEDALASSGQAGLPPGVIGVRFQDDPNAAGVFGGDYTVYLQFERVP
jgi:hypothetical protein